MPEERALSITRRYARLADNALLEVFPPPDAHRQATDKGFENKTETVAGLAVGPPGLEPGTVRL